MAKLKERLWLWGQSPDAAYGFDNAYNLPGHSRMTAAEGLYYFGLENVCRIRTMGQPMPPYDRESVALRPARRVVWSLFGTGIEPAGEVGEVEEIIRQAKNQDNIVGVVFDELFSSTRILRYTPEMISKITERIARKSERHIESWTVCSDIKLEREDRVSDFLKVFDVILYRTTGKNPLDGIDERIKKIKATAPKAKIMPFLYLWNYGAREPMSERQMQMQTEVYLDAIRKGQIDGFVISSNCIADLDICAAEYMREWIRMHGEDEVP